MNDLENVIVEMNKTNLELRKEIEQLKQALKKLSPYSYSCGFEHCLQECRFCGTQDEEHKQDCEYIKLIGS